MLYWRISSFSLFWARDYTCNCCNSLMLLEFIRFSISVFAKIIRLYFCGSLTHLPIMDSSHRYKYWDFAAREADQYRSVPLQLPGSSLASRVICGTDMAECVSVPGDFLRPHGAFALIRGMPLIRRMSIEPEALLGMPDACGLRPCAWTHLKWPCATLAH